MTERFIQALEFGYERGRFLCKTSPVFVAVLTLGIGIFVSMGIAGFVLGADPAYGFEISWPLLVIPSAFVFTAIAIVCLLIGIRKHRLRKNPEHIRVAPAPQPPPSAYMPIPNPMGLSGYEGPIEDASKLEILTIVQQ